jgi:hypothetical protein
MRLVRRLSAALSSVLLLQLSLLGSGSLCALQHPSGHVAMDGAAPGMRAMVHGAADGATVSTVMAQPSDTPDPAGGCGGNGPASSCDGPWATGPCSSMASCAWSQSAGVSSALTSARAEADVNHSQPRTLPAGPVVAPELPPPRA